MAAPRTLALISLATALLPGPVLAQGPTGTPVDLTHPFDETAIYWPTAEPFRLTVESSAPGAADWYAAGSFCAAEHGGTHLDAPVHFAEGRRSAAEIPLEDLMGPAVVIGVEAPAAADPHHRISVADLTAWEAEHGAIPPGSIVLLRTGWGARWGDAARYLGTAARGPGAVAELAFPGLDPEAAAWLVAGRAPRAIGIDTASIDRGRSTDYGAHRVLGAAEVPVFENVANLDRLPATGAWVIALPMKIGGGTGGPLRIVAFVPAAPGAEAAP